MKLSYFVATALLFTMLGCGGSETEYIYLDENSLKGNQKEIKSQNISIDLGESLDLNYNLDNSIELFEWYDNSKLISRKKSTIYTPTTSGKHTIKLITTDEDKNQDKTIINVDVKSENVKKQEPKREVIPKKTIPKKSSIKKPTVKKPVKEVRKKLKGVHVNEIVVANIDSGYDKDYYEFSDYIELKNHENKAIDLSGYTMSDDKKSWKFPKGSKIKANSYLLVWADKKNNSKNEHHTNFKLSAKKDRVLFKDQDGKTIDDISFKKLKADVAVTEVDGKLLYMKPTPNGKNSTMFPSSNISKEPTFSLSSGFYNGIQTISISSKSKAIYYTLDGSTPTLKSKLYVTPIKINKSSVIKAISIESGKVASEVAVNSYLIDFESTLPVASISMDSRYLFDDYIGIYTDGKNGKSVMACSGEDTTPKNFNQGWERPTHLEYFEADGTRAFSMGLDISISGQCSRFNSKKHFSFETSKSKYGKKSVEYALYPTKNINKFKDFKLRGGEAGFQVRDLVSSKLVESGNLNIDYQAYRAVRMFINGEYWGVYNIREKKGKDYLHANYPDLDVDNVDIIGNGIKNGDKKEYNKLHDFVLKHDLSILTNYQQILTMIDEDNFIDYMILMTYSGNRDWYDNNFRCWREKVDGAKWRWMLDDLDYGFIMPAKSNFDLATKTGTMMTDLFRELLKNVTFKDKFKSRYIDYLNTTFASDNMLNIIDELVNERREYFSLEHKWGISLNIFDKEVKRLRDFAIKRDKNIRIQLNKL